MPRITPPKKNKSIRPVEKYTEPEFDAFGEPMRLLVSVDGIAIYKNDIEFMLNDQAKQRGYDSPLVMHSNPWASLLRYVGLNFFGKYDILTKKTTFIRSDLRTETMTMTNKTLDEEVINALADYYIDLCNLYDKVVSVKDFLLFIGLKNNRIRYINNLDRYNNNTVNKDFWFLLGELFQKEREESLKNKLIDGQSVVGLISVCNAEYGWNDGNHKSNTQPTKSSLTVDQLPRLDTSDSPE